MIRNKGSFKPGAEHPNWNGGVTLSSKGYIKVNVGLEHPLADKSGFCYLHQLVWVAAGNAKPKLKRAIHHLNENKLDNRLANLREVDADEHGRIHHYTGSDETQTPKTQDQN